VTHPPTFICVFASYEPDNSLPLASDETQFVAEVSVTDAYYCQVEHQAAVDDSEVRSRQNVDFKWNSITLKKSGSKIKFSKTEKGIFSLFIWHQMYH
jgi:hypothetical protein